MRSLLVSSVVVFMLATSTADAQFILQSVGGLPASAENVDIVGFVGHPSDANTQFVLTGAGRIYIRVAGVINATPFLDITNLVFNRSSCSDCYGLLAMALAPDYGTSGRLYVLFTNEYGAWLSRELGPARVCAAWKDPPRGRQRP